MAPEVVKQTAHTLKADIWSVGCLVVEMLTGQRPWGRLDQMQVGLERSVLTLVGCC
jgi:mitogen-activated protein kinase kinase kinase